MQSQKPLTFQTQHLVAQLMTEFVSHQTKQEILKHIFKSSFSTDKLFNLISNGQPAVATDVLLFFATKNSIQVTSE